MLPPPRARWRWTGEKQEIYELGISDFTLRYAALSQRGYYPEDLFKANQDRYIIQTEIDGRMDFAFMGVFDGHGTEGDVCSGYVRKRVISELLKQMKRDRFRNDFSKAYIETFIVIDNDMHQEDDFDDSYSGSTAICACFFGSEMYIANIGDSRAIIAERHGKRIVAFPLSLDQTPYRRDERERVKSCGAVVQTHAMAEGEVKYTEDWMDNNLNEELDGTGDPPRVFAAGMLEPGCAFTRSIGDRAGMHIGVTAEAELLHKHLKETDQAIMIASDGVWEFMSNQAVVDMVFQFDDPVESCRAVVSQAYSLWLQFEVRTDDITLIVSFIDHKMGKAPRAASEEEIKASEMAMKMGSTAGTADGIAMGGAVSSGNDVKPVRRGLSAEKKKKLGVTLEAPEDEDEGEWVMETHKKTKAEIERIKTALKGNFLFQHLPETQTKQIYDCMRKTQFTAGEVIIQQGDKGESFYILDEGECKVTIENDGLQIEILRYRPNPTGANPCFGELALMYSKPRAATVTALTNGQVWEIDRRSFREILKKSSTKNLMRTLRSVEVLKSLSVHQLQRLSELLTEVKYDVGQFVIRQGEEGSTFYIISEGRAVVTKNDGTERGKEVATIHAGQYFGERAILKSEVRAANVIAGGDAAKGEKLHCLYISKESFEEVLGPLSKIIEDDASWRYKIAVVKQLRKKAAGLTNAKIDDFEIKGLIAEAPPVKYVAAKHKGKFDKEGKLVKEGLEYTLKVRSKKQVVDMNMQARLRSEMKLLTSMSGNKLLFPLPLQTIEDDSYIYSVIPTRVASTIADLIEQMEQIDEDTCRFFAAVISEAVQGLHEECPALGGIIYRNLDPQAITLSEDGWPQLMDMRFACAAEPPPRDFCGQVHYLAPEQVAGNGHGVSVDFWSLGILLYEMLTSSNPWLTGDPKSDSELNIFNRITGHKKGALKFPDGVTISADLSKFLNELLEPSIEQRLGCKTGKLAYNSREQIRKHKWFEGFKWDELQNGTLASPAKMFCKDAHNKAIKKHLRDSQVVGLFDEVYVPEEGDTADFNVNETADMNFKDMKKLSKAETKKHIAELQKAREERQAKMAEVQDKHAQLKAAIGGPTEPSVHDRPLVNVLASTPGPTLMDEEAERKKAAMFGSLSANVHSTSDTIAFTEQVDKSKQAEEDRAKHNADPLLATEPQETFLEGLGRRASAAADAIGEQVKKLTDRPEPPKPAATAPVGFGGWTPPTAGAGTPSPVAPVPVKAMTGFGGWVPPGSAAPNLAA